MSNSGIRANGSLIVTTHISLAHGYILFEIHTPSSTAILGNGVEQMSNGGTEMSGWAECMLGEF